MKKKIPQLAAVAILAFGGGSYAGVCKSLPGNMNCGKGNVESLEANGAVNLNGTNVLGETVINGLLMAEDSNFNGVDVNGNAEFIQCSINHDALIKGALKASSSKFNGSLGIYSNATRLINTLVDGDIHVYHTNPAKQVVYLDNFSRVTGNVVFDDGQGEVVLRGQSKVEGKIIGGNAVSK